MRAGLIIRLAALWRGGRVVVTEDYKGVCRFSIAMRSPFGKLMCAPYWPHNIGSCILRDDGTVDPASDSPHIKRWKYA